MTAVTMTSFTRWNELLLQEFFSPAASGDEVWLHTSRVELDSFGIHLGGASGLAQAVIEGPGWFSPPVADCAEAAAWLVRQRKAAIRPRGYVDPGLSCPEYAGAKAPTYLPILALWVLASSEKEGGFYAQVSALLRGTPFGHLPSTRQAMAQTWQDLEDWSAGEAGGRFGRFTRKVLGEHLYVGMPRSQCLVSRNDVRGLHQLFWERKLRPGQQLSATMMRSLQEAGKQSPMLSRPLREAMARPEYQTPLHDVIARKLREWDGKRPVTTGSAPAGLPSANAPVHEEQDLEVTVALMPAADDDGRWAVKWRFPAVGDLARCRLRIASTEIPAVLERTGDCFVTASTDCDSYCKQLLAESAARPLSVTLAQEEPEDGEASALGYSGRIRASKRRLLAWDKADPSLGEMLVERGWPLRGPAYLLHLSSDRLPKGAAPGRQGIRLEDVPADGLPGGWRITCVLDPASLEPSQRLDLFPNESGELPRARVRWVGGRRMLRGGSQLYASYDLPMAEVEAPEGASVHAEGLRLEAEWTLRRGGFCITRHRVRVLPEAGTRSVFELFVSESGQMLASRRLRLSPDDGEGVGAGRPFSLDRTGRAIRHVLGLRGASLAPEVGSKCGPLIKPLKIQSLGADGNPLGAGDPPPAALFLDTLAQLGSVAYGAAKEQLLRLGDHARTRLQPALTLLELRASGHLELETDNKGHLVRVHSVQPTLYSLPATYSDLGFPVFAACGSLRLAHWSRLGSDRQFITGNSSGGPAGLPVVRFAAMATGDVEQFCSEHGMAYESMPAPRVAEWAAALDDVRDELSRRALEAASAELDQLHRLKPDRALFARVDGRRMHVDPSTGCQLFRFDDHHAPGLQLYALGLADGGRTTYTHVHDSRWGVWLAENAFAAMLRDHYGLLEASPWPIVFDPATRDLWLPARLRPPFVLERSLVLCSGSPPLEAQLEAESVSHQLRVRERGGRTTVAHVSPVYMEFLPGTWLQYRWVPQQVAEAVASRLGGRLFSPAEDQKAAA